MPKIKFDVLQWVWKWTCTLYILFIILFLKKYWIFLCSTVYQSKTIETPSHIRIPFESVLGYEYRRWLSNCMFFFIFINSILFYILVFMSYFKYFCGINFLGAFRICRFHILNLVVPTVIRGNENLKLSKYLWKIESKESRSGQIMNTNRKPTTFYKSKGIHLTFSSSWNTH